MKSPLSRRINSLKNYPKQLKRRTRRIIGGIFIFLFLLFATAYTLAYVYRDKMVVYVTEKLNENLITPLAVPDVDVSFVSTFPNVGLTLRDVNFSDTLNKKRFNILEIKKLVVEFGLGQLILGQLSVRKIVVDGGVYNTFRDKTGKIHKLTIKKKKKDPEKTPDKFIVPKIIVKNFELITANDSRGAGINLLIALANGKLESEVISLLTFSNVQGNLRYFRTANIDLLQNEAFKMTGEVNINPDSNKVEFKSTSGTVAGLNISLDGYMKQLSDTSKYQNIHFTGTSQNTEFLRAFVPNELKEDLFSVEGGATRIDLLSFGNVSQTFRPATRLSFLIINGRMQHPETLEGLTAINLSGAINTSDSLPDKRSTIRMKGTMEGHFKTLDVLNPPKEYRAMLGRYSAPDVARDTAKKVFSRLPDQVDLKLKMKVDELIYKKARAKNVAFAVTMDHQEVQIDELKGNAFGGDFSLRAVFANPDSGKFNLRLHADLNRINIQALFKDFSDFNQQFIHSENIRGKASLSITASTQLDQKFEPIIPSAEVNGIAKFTKPEIVNWKLLMDALKLAKDQTSHLYLDDSEIRFVLNNSTLYVSPMEVNSSLTRFDASAIQVFDRDMDFLLRINVADQFLSSGTKRKKEIKSGERSDKDRNWGFVNVNISGRPKNLKFDILKKESYSVKIQEHRRKYEQALRNVAVNQQILSSKLTAFSSQ